jgi:hypothetical protein
MKLPTFTHELATITWELPLKYTGISIGINGFGKLSTYLLVAINFLRS